MNLSIGIVGLPNVGKSTLFNALLKKQQALAANYPFATIEPNVGIIPVPDERLEALADIVASGSSTSGESSSATPEVLFGKRPPIKPATVEFVDIAGLVKGASEGSGLGNKFLSHIREVSIIAHVVRVFEDANVIKEGSVDPMSDYKVIQTELILADLETLEKAKGKRQKAKVQVKSQNILDKIEELLNKGIPARDVGLIDGEQEVVKDLFLLSSKPEIIVLNVAEDQYTQENIPKVIEEYNQLLFSVIPDPDRGSMDSRWSPVFTMPRFTPRATTRGGNDNMVVICAKIESELAVLSEDEQKEYLGDLGLEESGLERLIKKAYETLGLISFLTAPASADASARQGGKYEVRAWTVPKGIKAVDAAGVIHTDFEKKFIKAEVVSFDDFVQNKGWKGSREAGRARLEGRDYIVKDGDVIEFKIGS